MTATNHPFAHALRELRGAARLSQEELATRAGLSTRAVSDLERGVHPYARRSTLVALADALGLHDDERESLLRLGTPERRREPRRARVPRVLVRERSRSVLRGRDAEMALLHASWDRASDGSAGLAIVSGAAGIGKTRLLAELAAVASTCGTVLYARGDDALNDPYHAFVQLLRELMAAITPEEFVAGAAGDAALLAVLLPELGLDPPPRATRADLFHAIARTIERATRDAPCLVVLDDVQYADRDTLHVLRHVLRANAERRLLFAIGFRPERELDDTTLRTVIADLAREMPVTRVALRGLDVHDVGQVVADQLGRPLPAVAGALHTDTAGNPFFVSELVAHMRTLGRVDERAWRRGRRFVDDVGVPEVVRDLLAARLGRLDRPARDLLVHGAVIGVEFGAHLTGAIAGLPPEQVFALVDDAVATGIVAEHESAVGRWRFVHPLVREVVLADVSHGLRTRLHARIVASLETCNDESPETLDLLAYHSFRSHSLPGMAERAVQHARRAADDAGRVFAWERVATQYERAVTVLDAQPDRDERALCDILLALGDARVRALERQHALPVFLRAAEIAQRLGSPDRLALAAIGYGYMAKAEVVDAHALDLWDRALAATADPALRSTLLAARATHQTFAGHDDEAREQSEEALAIARTTTDPRALAMALAARSITLWGTPEIERRYGLARELAALGLLAGNDEWLLDAIELAGVPLLELGEIEEFDRVCEGLMAAGRRTGRAASIAQSTQWMAMRALMRGELDRARALAADVIELAPNAPNFATGFAAQQYAIARLAGAHHELLPFVAGAAANEPDALAWTALHARALADAGDIDAARDRLAEVVARLPASPRNWTWTVTLALAADAAARTDDREAACVIEPLLQPFSGRFVVVASGTSCEGAVDRYLGLLAAVRGEIVTACGLLDGARRAEAAIGADALVVATALDHASMFRRTGARAAVRDAEWLEAEAAAAAARCGVVHTGAFTPVSRHG